MASEYLYPPYTQNDGTIVRHYICDTEQDLPGTAAPGSVAYIKATEEWWTRRTNNQWTSSGGAAAPHDHDGVYSAEGHTHGGGGGEAFPVGSVFIAVVSTNPATLLGYGTWAAFGAGRTLVGIDAGQTEFDTVKETGGAKTHTLIEAEMPSHAHVENQNSATTGALAGWGARDTSTSTSIATGYSTAATGGGGAHNNLQPYIVVYMWERTA